MSDDATAARSHERPQPVALVLRHDASIGLGNLEPTLVAHGYRIRIVDAPAGGVPDLDPLSADLVVVLGGEEAAYETHRHPYLADEIALLRARIDAHAPVFGVCLGAQLVAATLGARVYRGERKEVGWLEVTPTAVGAASPVRHFAGVPTVQWHGDHYDLPDDVELLATSPQYPNQAYRRGDWLLAVQFHPEVDERIHADWLAAWGDQLPTYGWTRESMLEAQSEHGARASEASTALLGEYLDGLAARRPAAA